MITILEQLAEQIEQKQGFEVCEDLDLTLQKIAEMVRSFAPNERFKEFVKSKFRLPNFSMPYGIGIVTFSYEVIEKTKDFEGLWGKVLSQLPQDVIPISENGVLHAITNGKYAAAFIVEFASAEWEDNLDGGAFHNIEVVFPD